MNFATPTNKTEMYNILKEIFSYYRIKRDPLEEVMLVELDLERLNYSVPSTSELTAKAEKLVEAENQKEIIERKEKIQDKISEINAEITLLNNNFDKEVAEIETVYNQSYTKFQQTAIKNGLINTSAYLDKLAKIDAEKTSKITLLTTEKNEKITSLQAKLSVLEEKLNGATSFFSTLHAARKNAKMVELKDASDAIKRDVDKYNSGLDEKEQRYKNTLAQANANLKLKYMEISLGEYSKDELVDMGYYDEAVKCVTSYYDPYDPLVAYNDIIRETKLAVYLDDYYQNIVYMYGSRAGVY